MRKLWEWIGNLVKLVFNKVLHIEFTEESWKKLCQFMKFGIVGVSNTLISYIVYSIFIMLNVHYLLSSLFGFLISVINAYYWNNKYVFKIKKGENRTWWQVFLKTFTSYAGTGLILNNILLILWVDILNINEMLGPLINLFITIPLNFFLNKNWAFRDKK